MHVSRTRKSPIGAAPRLEHVFETLGPRFYDPVTCAVFPARIERFFNHRWAERVGFAELDELERVRRFAAFEPFEGSFKKPLAIRYHGHQFRVYNPDIGDGRGFLYAQARDLEDGRLLDFGTKGSGRTPYSRTGDGRLTLKGGVREVLASTMLEALGVYTSKTFALFETGEALVRGDEPSPTRSAVMTRLSHGHVRFGVFQRMAATEEPDAIEALIDYVLHNLIEAPGEGPPALRMFEAVVAACAELAASWMAAGFVHGVLNTDNMVVTGESFDYGPWRFLPILDYGFVAAYFDHRGLYAFGRQPDSVLWNLARLAETLPPFAEKTDLEAALGRFPEAFRAALVRRTVERLGLEPRDAEKDAALAQAWLGFLEVSKAPFEAAHFDHWAYPVAPERARSSARKAFYQGEAYEAFLKAAAGHEPVRAEAHAHPYFEREGPGTLLIEEVEALWAAIAEDDDWAPLENKLADIEAVRTAHAFDPDAGRAERALRSQGGAPLG